MRFFQKLIAPFSKLAGGTTEHPHLFNLFTAVWQGRKHSEKPAYKALSSAENSDVAEEIALPKMQTKPAIQ